MSEQWLHTAYIGLGSNLPDGDLLLAKALDRIRHDGIVSVLETSHFYTTKPYGGVGPDYFNGVARIATSLPYDRLNLYFKGIEAGFGRVRVPRSSAPSASTVYFQYSVSPKVIPVDIDVVIFDSEITRPSDFSRSYFQLGYSCLSYRPCLLQ